MINQEILDYLNKLKEEKCECRIENIIVYHNGYNLWQISCERCKKIKEIKNFLDKENNEFELKINEIVKKMRELKLKTFNQAIARGIIE